MNKIDEEWLNRVLSNLERHPENWKFAKKNRRLKTLLTQRFCEIIGLFQNYSELKTK